MKKERCQKHDVEIGNYQGKENVCFICQNERRANQRHLEEQRQISEVKSRFRNRVF